MTNQPNNESLDSSLHVSDLSDIDTVPDDLPAKDGHHHHLHASDLRLEPEGTHHHSQHRHHKHKRHHHHRHHKKKRRLLIVLVAIFGTLLLIALIAGIAITVLRETGRSELLSDPDQIEITAPTTPAIQIYDNGQRVFYNGETYLFNKNRTNILFIGTDRNDMSRTDDVIGTGGQADTIFLLSLDTETGAMDVITVSRDAMADIELYDKNGAYLGTENTQICLAYAYGDGRETSCENMVHAVSRLLYGIPINTYVAMDMTTIATLNDAIGGVEVSLLNDFQTGDGVWHAAGETITLHGEEANRYVRDRDTSVLDSNNARMERQKQYASAFFAKATAAASSDISVPLNLYGTVTSDSITSLSTARITYLALTVLAHHSEPVFKNVPGTVLEGANEYAEYRVDEGALYPLILNVFYTKE
ncbi:MAG: LCP family protein [Clostridia bacterium]|nr:LCP family protein [Clostridia bacterium]